MKLENSFDVDAPPEAAWALLMDVPRVVPCMPGAELVDTVDDSTWKARMRVKLGPMSLVFDADVERIEVDETARRVVLKAAAREARGRGRATATIASTIQPEVAGGGSRVDIATDVLLAGTLAQFGRGVVQDVSAQLVGSFATCLQSELAAPAEPPAEQEAAGSAASSTEPAAATPSPAPSPISAGSLVRPAVRGMAVRLLSRLPGLLRAARRLLDRAIRIARSRRGRAP